MLVLTRKKRQTIVIGDPGGGAPLLLITVLEVARGRVQIGFTTTTVNTAVVPIHRGEMWTGSVERAGAPCHANGDGADGSEVSASIPGRLDDTAGVLGASCPAASPPTRSMHDIVAMARSRQRPVQPAVVSEPDLVAEGVLR